jgi:hypothetical protein
MQRYELFCGPLSRCALAQFIKQTRILDGDDGLGGKVLHKLDLLIREGTKLLAVDDENAQQCRFPNYRHSE